MTDKNGKTFGSTVPTIISMVIIWGLLQLASVAFLRESVGSIKDTIDRLEMRVDDLYNIIADGK